MPTSPTQLSLKKLRGEGWVAEVTEKWNQWAHIRQDLFGFVDVFALGDGEAIGVQATSASNLSSRVKKILSHENTRPWLEAGLRLVVWGWVKRKLKPHHKALRWTVVEREITLEDLSGTRE